MNFKNHDHKIAFYIRVSTEEQAASPEGSIRNQEERLREQVVRWQHGDIAGIYIDRAKSGKDINRPELQRLLRDIKERKITLVMVMFVRISDSQCLPSSSHFFQPKFNFLFNRR